jgi:hypothetical protein
MQRWSAWRCCFCCFRYIYRTVEQAGRVSQDIPVNHSAAFAPVLQPTLDTGTDIIAAAVELGIQISHTLLDATSPSSTAKSSPLR